MQINGNDFVLGKNSRSRLCLDFTVVCNTFAGKLSGTRALFVPVSIQHPELTRHQFWPKPFCINIINSSGKFCIFSVCCMSLFSNSSVILHIDFCLLVSAFVLGCYAAVPFLELCCCPYFSKGRRHYHMWFTECFGILQDERCDINIRYRSFHFSPAHTVLIGFAFIWSSPD